MTKSNKTCLWQEVTSQLVDYIDKNDLKPGVAFFSTNQVAERFGVSDITSRRALSELAKMNLVERARGRGCVIKHHRQVKTIYIITGDDKLESFVYSELYKGILDECRLHNIETKVASYAFLDNIPENTRMDILLLQNFPTHLPILARRLTNDKSLNCVCCHALKPIKGMSTLRADLGAGAYDLVSHLIDRGHRRIAYIGKGTDGWSASRFDGYYRALKDNDIDIDMGLVKSTELNEECHFAAMDELMKLDEPPTAVFNVSDVNALFVLNYCLKNNIKIPEDLAITGFDNIPEVSHTNPPLTTIDSRLEEEGRESIRLLLQHLPESDVVDKLVKPEMIVRDST
ncbi:MAG: substrate-binding domain-containing protein [Lentisphaerae bacterium]|nr:substrate-binding domain-containing protein [Lentisphaerota bacterium]MCP4102789.1 substrate-binding domain-containing protein [Lentisphaerota bacterium]